jgi:hypothetical protein
MTAGGSAVDRAALTLRALPAIIVRRLRRERYSKF